MMFTELNKIKLLPILKIAFHPLQCHVLHQWQCHNVSIYKFDSIKRFRQIYENSDFVLINGPEAILLTRWMSARSVK